MATGGVRHHRRRADHDCLHCFLSAQAALGPIERQSEPIRFSAMSEMKFACPHCSHQMKSALLPIVATEQLLKRTTSRCLVCHAACPAEVWRIDGRPAKVFLKRTCPAHGEATVCIASDARFYWLAQGNRGNAFGCCGAACCAADSSTSAGRLSSRNHASEHIIEPGASRLLDRLLATSTRFAAAAPPARRSLLLARP